MDSTDSIETITTLRDYEVVNRIKDFISEHKLHPGVGRQIFQLMVKINCPLKRPINPTTQTLVFNEEMVNEGFKMLEVDKIPKAADNASDNIDETTVEELEELEDGDFE